MIKWEGTGQLLTFLRPGMALGAECSAPPTLPRHNGYCVGQSPFMPVLPRNEPRSRGFGREASRPPWPMSLRVGRSERPNAKAHYTTGLSGGDALRLQRISSTNFKISNPCQGQGNPSERNPPHRALSLNSGQMGDAAESQAPLCVPTS